MSTIFQKRLIIIDMDLTVKMEKIVGKETKIQIINLNITRGLIKSAKLETFIKRAYAIVSHLNEMRN